MSDWGEKAPGRTAAMVDHRQTQGVANDKASRKISVAECQPHLHDIKIAVQFDIYGFVGHWYAVRHGMATFGEMCGGEVGSPEYGFHTSHSQHSLFCILLTSFATR